MGKNLIKWLLKTFERIDVFSIVDFIWDELIPGEEWIDWFCDKFAKLADKTKNQIDDEFVENMREMLKDILLKKAK